jgi:amino acid efflux transporter
MNVYVAASARLAAAVAAEGALPRWLAGDAWRSVPRRPLAALAVLGTAVLVPLALGVWTPAALIRATSACFVAVYVLALLSAVRILDGRARAAAAVALASVTVVLGFSSFYLAFPAAGALVALGCRRFARPAATPIR